jgi:hypothetical protein
MNQPKDTCAIAEVMGLSNRHVWIYQGEMVLCVFCDAVWEMDDEDRRSVAYAGKVLGG